MLGRYNSAILLLLRHNNKLLILSLLAHVLLFRVREYMLGKYNFAFLFLFKA